MFKFGSHIHHILIDDITVIFFVKRDIKVMCGGIATFRFLWSKKKALHICGPFRDQCLLCFF